MPSAFTASLMACKIPAQLANLLGFSGYQALATLLYPAPSYKEFSIKKRDGSERQIYAPGAALKVIQRKLNSALLELDNSRPPVHGFRIGRSIVTNASVHLAKAYVLNIDLETFFPSIHFGRIYGLFQNPPFSFPPAVSAVLARICTYKGMLPQGAPTSPTLSNFVCRGLDGSLQALAKANFATYSRYADDISFSFSRKHRDHLPTAIVGAVGAALVGAELRSTVISHGFEINDKKVRLRSQHSRMEVTGLSVNEKVNVRRAYVDEIRGILHSWEKFGLPATEAVFSTKTYKRQLHSGTRPTIQHVLRGKLLYLHMVKGLMDPVYNKLARKFNKLAASSPTSGVGFVPTSKCALTLQDIESAVYVLSARDEDNNFEIKSSCFFLESIGIVTADHCVRYPIDNLDHAKKPLFPAELRGDYFGFAPSAKLYIQDILENDLCELQIVWGDATSDLAVLKPRIAGATVKHLTMSCADLTKFHGAQSVLLAGFPFHNPGKSLSTAEGKIRSRYRRYGIAHFDISALIRKGNSGGPVLDGQLRVVGVATEGERQDGGNNAVVQLPELLQKHASFAVTAWNPLSQVTYPKPTPTF